MRSRPIRVVIRLLAILVCLAGMAIGYKLTMDHVEANAPLNGEQAEQGEEGGLLDAVCEALPASNCESVSQSRWGTFPFGAKEDERPYIPTATLGLFFYTAVLCWLVLIGSCSPDRWWAHLILVAGTAFGLGCSAYLDYIMWAIVYKEQGTWCTLCFATHIGSLLLFVFTLLLWPRKPRGAGRAESPAAAPARPKSVVVTRPWPTWPLLVLTLIIALLAGGLENFYVVAVAKTRYLDVLTSDVTTDNPEQMAVRIKELEKKLKTEKYYHGYWKKNFKKYDRFWRLAYHAWVYTPPVAINTENRPIRGPDDAKKTMVIFTDFQCPKCKEFEDQVHNEIVPLAERTGGLKVVFKHWPICTDCNEFAYNNLHPRACRASLAAEAARIVGGDEAFWKMHDLLWERQQMWKNTGDFAELAGEIGLDEEAFTGAMESDEARNRVKADIEEGANLGKGVLKDSTHEFVKVTGTPSVFVDNKLVWRKRSNKEFWSLILRTPVRRSSESQGGGNP